MIETLETAIRRGEVGRLRDFYHPASRLEAYLPSETLIREGRDEIVALFADWWPAEGRFAHWSATSYETGVELLFERHPVGERPWASRQWHEIHIRDGLVARHFIWSDKPRHVVELSPLPDSISAIVEDSQRTPLYEGGFSGSRLERIVTPDGTNYFLKHVSPRHDLLLRTTNDTGREAALYTSGVLERVADVIDYPVVAVAPEEDGSAILLRDVSDSLLTSRRREDRPGADERRTILRAVGRLHEAFRQQHVHGACTVENRLSFLGARVMAHESAGPEALPRWIRSSWEVFFDLVPADVADAVAAVHDDPGPLADQLATAETTLIHGDLWAPNIGRAPERIILLDWALAAQAPPEMEHAFWTLWNSRFMNVTPGMLLNEVRADFGDGLDERVMLLALLGEFVSGAGARGWAWNSVNGLDPAARAGERDELDWWIDRVREALDRAWSPV